MRPIRIFALAATLAALVTHVPAAHAAWQHSPFGSHLTVCDAPGIQTALASVSDGAGGMIVVWEDRRSGGSDLYAQRISATGVPMWTANGVAVCIGAVTRPCLVSDGAGGAVIAWEDVRAGSSVNLYAQRLSASGAALWTAGGLAVVTSTGAQDSPVIAEDGDGGAIIAWRDTRNGNDDVYAQHLLSSGFNAWPVNGAAICSLAGTQTAPAICADGAGGAYIAWTDQRAGNSDIYAQRVDTGGTRLWTSGGVAVISAALSQGTPRILSAGASGALIAWLDDRSGSPLPYVQSITASGAPRWNAAGVQACALAGSWSAPMLLSDGASGLFLVWSGFAQSDPNHSVRAQHVNLIGLPEWGVNGIAVSDGTTSQTATAIASDGNGGVLVNCTDSRVTGPGYYLHRIAWNGTLPWRANGVLVSGFGSTGFAATMVADGTGGAVTAWVDMRDGVNENVYAQYVDRNGLLGDAAPLITEARDVAHDQGGRLKLSWRASYIDVEPAFGITDYRVWRSVPTHLAFASGAAPRERTTDADEAAATGKLLVEPSASLDYAWEYVVTSPAAGLPSYSVVLDTESDSTGTGNPRTAYRVEARATTARTSPRWFSAPDSGYSVDNLAPLMPAPLTGQYAAGTTRLHWNRNTETDLAGYRLYRGGSLAFVPSPSNFIAALPDTGAADAAGAPYVYKLTAVDVHGNESPVATLIPSGTLGVGDGATLAALSFAAPSPNPARGSATLRYSLSTRGHVKLALFDAAGRRVVTVAEGVMEAGEHSATLALRDDAGRELPAGLYLARLEAEGRVLTRRIAAVR